MPSSEIRKNIEAAISNAAKHVADADSVEEANQWQVVQNQQQQALKDLDVAEGKS